MQFPNVAFECFLLSVQILIVTIKVSNWGYFLFISVALKLQADYTFKLCKGFLLVE